MSVCLSHPPALTLPLKSLVPVLSACQHKWLVFPCCRVSLCTGIRYNRAQREEKHVINQLLFKETSQFLGLTSQNLPGLGVIAFAQGIPGFLMSCKMYCYESFPARQGLGTHLRQPTAPGAEQPE